MAQRALRHAVRLCDRGEPGRHRDDLHVGERGEDPPYGGYPEAQARPRRDLSGVHQDLFIGRGFGQLLDEKKQRELSRFGWVDKDKRVVSIPIDQAMDLVIEESRR